MKTRTSFKYILFFLFLFSFSSLSSADLPDKMAWWREARFGMFIHWGVYAVYGNVYDGPNVEGQTIHYDQRATGFPSEWIMYAAPIPRSVYREAAKKFDAKDYDPKEWVRIAKQAGMKYIVITAKHHDGFCLFETKHTDWNSTDASAAGRDLLKDLVEEAKAAGLKIGFYYSQNLDWMTDGGMGLVPELNYGEYPIDKVHEYVDNLVVPHIIELTTNYDIDIFWFDFPSVNNTNQEIADKILNTLLDSPVGKKIIYNDRLIAGFDGDFTTPETAVPYVPYNGYDNGRDWEACSSLDNSWGWQYERTDNPYYTTEHVWKSSVFIINRILELASKGGNFLLNVGPDKQGNIPDLAKERLEKIGDWMQIYGETIYGTVRNNLVNPFEFGYVTRKQESNGSVHWYLHIPPEFWEEKKIVLPGVSTLPGKTTVFETKEDIDASIENGNLIITLPDSYPNPVYSTIDVLFNEEPVQVSKTALRDNVVRLTPYQALTKGYTTKDFIPYIIRGFNSHDSEIEFNVFLEKGDYRFEAEYSTWTHGAEVFFSVDDTTFSVDFKATSTDVNKIEELVFVKEQFDQAQFTLSESKFVKIKVTRSAPIEYITSWISFKSIGLIKTDNTSIENKEPDRIISSTWIRDGHFTIQSEPGKAYRLVGIDGRVYKEIRTDDFATLVDVRDLRSGMYIVHGNGFSQKVFIQH